MGTDHYFSPNQPTGDEPKSSFQFTVDGHTLTVATDRGVFARKGLDIGTEILLESVPRPPANGNLLDLGCGSGAIALTLATQSPHAQVYAVDVNPRAVELCARNATRNGLTNVHALLDSDVSHDLTFDTIWSNPPIRIGKAELHRMLATWLSRLSSGATAWFVVNRNLGADSLSVWLSDRGCHVERATSKRGFRVLGVTPTPDADLWRP